MISFKSRLYEVLGMWRVHQWEISSPLIKRKLERTSAGNKVNTWLNQCESYHSISLFTSESFDIIS